jgi:putative ABC transport system permease protein
MKEVAVRKSFGAQRGQLIRQLLGESMIISALALALAASLFELFRQGLQTILPRASTVGLAADPVLLLSSLALIVVVGVLAGAYPALCISRIRPIAVLQSRTRVTSSRSWLRKGLVVFQFTLAILFVLSTVILTRQFNYLAGMDLGFDPDNVLVLRFSGPQAAENCRVVNSEVLAHTPVGSAATSNHALGTTAGSYRFYTDPERRREDMLLVKSYAVDDEFLSFYDLRVVQGRGFSDDHPEDLNHGILINESLAQELGVGNPLGSKLYRQDGFYEVIGVVEDFIGTALNYSYHAKTVLRWAPDDCNLLTVRLPRENISGTVSDIREIWNKTLPTEEFTASFLSDDIRAEYGEMQNMISFFSVLALVSIGIGCLGILGLVSYTAAQKTREIGIRKVLGASVVQIVSLLGREFAMLIVIANAIAAPLAYLWMNMYLQEFPFRVSLGLGTFAAGGVLALLIALAAAGWQSVKAALANPVDSLRHE